MNPLRPHIRATVAAIPPLDPAEAAARSSVLDWIDSGAPLFRDQGPVPPRHLAVYFALVDVDRRTVLQVDHIKAGPWVFPGGHVDTEEPARAVRREASEEPGGVHVRYSRRWPRTLSTRPTRAVRLMARAGTGAGYGVPKRPVGRVASARCRMGIAS